MEDALDPNEVDPQEKSVNYFPIGIAASVILHLICTFIIIGLPQGSPTSQSVTYIDLSLPQHAPSPSSVPQKKAAPQVAAKPEMPIPQKPAAPEALPEVEQPKVATNQPAPQEAKVEEPKVEVQRSHTTLGLGLTKGYFKSLGDGQSLREGVKDYYLEMLQGINEKWWLDQQLDKKKLDPVVVNITVARNGDIVGSEVMISSGNPRYDRAVLAALTAASPLPPLPQSYQGDYFQAPLRLVPPLNLMSW